MPSILLRTRIIANAAFWTTWFVASILGSLAAAQQKSTESKHNPLQRWLPLPSDNPNRSLLEEQLKNPSNPKSFPKKDVGNGGKLSDNDAQAKMLQQMIKEMGDELPPGVRVPKLDGLSNEAITKALSDPEVRKRAERIIEQYSRENPGRYQPSFSNPKSAPGPNQKKPPEPSNTRQPQSEPVANVPYGNESAAKNADSGASRIADAERASTAAGPTNPSSVNRKNRVADNSSMRPDTNPRLSSDRPDKTTLSREEIKKKLDKEGFESTLKGIVEQASKTSRQQTANQVKKEGTQEPKAGTNGPSNSSQAKSKSELDSSRRSNMSDSGQPRMSSASPAPKQSTDPSPAAAGWSKTANDWFSYVSKEIATAATQSRYQQKRLESNAPGSKSEAISGRPVDIPSTGLWIPFLVLVSVGLVVYLAYFTSKRVQQKRIASLAEGKRFDLLRAPDTIRTRADVVRAFHQLAFRIASPLESWWTHRSIAREICKTSPAVQSPLNVAVEIYEQARYFPSELKLSNDQLDSVRLALKECEAEKN